MARRMRRLTRHLRTFFATVSAVGGGRRARVRAAERQQLATELLVTLSPEVLAQTGHWRRMAPAARAAKPRAR
jgi:hypothetical protein